MWESYGVPQYLYTDAGRDFTSKHLENVTTSLGIVQCLRRKPSDGGIVERALGTINREFFATPRLKAYRVAAEGDACLSLAEVEKHLVRYIADGAVKPALAATYPLRDLQQAQAAFIAKEHTGNIVVIP